MQQAKQTTQKNKQHQYLCQAALKEKRPRAYEDFEAVAEAIVKNKLVLGKEWVGGMGGSNGGLLMGNMLVREGSTTRFQALVCQCPLIE